MPQSFCWLCACCCSGRGSMWTAPQPECSGSLKQPTLWRSRATTLPHATRTAVRPTRHCAALRSWACLCAAIFWISSTRRWPCCRPVPRPTAWQTSRWRRSAPAPRSNRCGNHFSADFERLSSISFSSSIKVLTSLN